ncbi:hypothetical protein C8P69_11615 [Phreatobacter oligotrophus]|uniref:Uncharacterized protein n=1 Tax=Phreatobacter oligotrophus TaxID=1122261 RepID=A0A2T4YX19_9HYPH|nr:hypothetical protein C8P69_11615 [Phreatobacter oligotrophus]
MPQRSHWLPAIACELVWRARSGHEIHQTCDCPIVPNVIPTKAAVADSSNGDVEDAASLDREFGLKHARALCAGLVHYANTDPSKHPPLGPRKQGPAASVLRSYHSSSDEAAAHDPRYGISSLEEKVGRGGSGDLSKPRVLASYSRPNADPSQNNPITASCRRPLVRGGQRPKRLLMQALKAGAWAELYDHCIRPLRGARRPPTWSAQVQPCLLGARLHWGAMPPRCARPGVGANKIQVAVAMTIAKMFRLTIAARASGKPSGDGGRVVWSPQLGPVRIAGSSIGAAVPPNRVEFRRWRRASHLDHRRLAC